MKEVAMVVMMSDRVVFEKEDGASELVSPVSEAWTLRIYLISLQSAIGGSVITEPSEWKSRFESK